MDVIWSFRRMNEGSVEADPLFHRYGLRERQLDQKWLRMAGAVISFDRGEKCARSPR